MSVKYSAADKDLFLQILASYQIIEDKKTDANNIARKKKAWERIAIEYNAVADEKRSIIQLKRLWDKTKRNRKIVLAEERRELMATGGGPSKPPPSPQPEIDNLIPYLEFEVDNDADSDGINLTNTGVVHVVQEATPGPLSATDGNLVAANPPSASDENSMAANSPSTSSRNPVADTAPANKGTNRNRKQPRNYLNELTVARLQLIKKEEAQLDQLHKVRMEEALYRKEAARLVMLQEEAKLKQLMTDNAEGGAKNKTNAEDFI